MIAEASGGSTVSSARVSQALTGSRNAAL